MINILILLFLLIPLIGGIWLVKPNLINQRVGKDFGRKKILSLSLVASLLNFVSIGVFAEPVAKTPEAEQIVEESIEEIKIEEESDLSDQAKEENSILGVANQQEQSNLSPSPSSAPTSSSSPTPTPSPRPQATPNPTLRPTVKSTTIPVQTSTPAPEIRTLVSDQKTSSNFSCNCSKACTQISSCEEAYFQLNNCGCNKRDGDNDGVPCEELCK